MVGALTSYAVPLLVGSLILAVLWSARARRRKRFKVRMDQVTRAGRLSAVHRKELATFLAGDSPCVMKDALVRLSDALTDPALTLAVAEAMARGERHAPASDEAAFYAAFAHLRSDDPESCTTFAMAALSGLYAAVLRSEKAVTLFEAVVETMAADHGREAEIVMTASRVRRAGAAHGFGGTAAMA